MTASKCWRLVDERATLLSETLEAIVDLRRPNHGLTALRAAGTALAGSLLGVAGAESPRTAPRLPSEHYVRGADLVVSYGGEQERPVRVDALWRSLEPPLAGGWLAAVDLIVSLRTALWDAQPSLEVSSRLAAADVLWLQSGPKADFRSLDVGKGEPLSLGPGDGPGCILVRLLQPGLSYAEMVHPADFHLATILPADGAGGPIGLCYRLFPHTLEKGVMLRARVRGLVLPREHDARLAAAAYAAFSTAEPPLGT